MTLQPAYAYNATSVRVIDGDTIVATIDLGFRIMFETPIRLAGINAPELSTAAGQTAHDYLLSIITPQLVILSKKNPRDKYGRWLGYVYNAADTSKSLDQMMLDSGNAVVDK